MMTTITVDDDDEDDDDDTAKAAKRLRMGPVTLESLLRAPTDEQYQAVDERWNQLKVR